MFTFKKDGPSAEHSQCFTSSPAGFPLTAAAWALGLTQWMAVPHCLPYSHALSQEGNGRSMRHEGRSDRAVVHNVAKQSRGQRRFDRAVAPKASQQLTGNWHTAGVRTDGHQEQEGRGSWREHCWAAGVRT